MARRSTRKRKATNPKTLKVEETNELDERVSVKKEEEQGELENGAPGLVPYEVQRLELYVYRHYEYTTMFTG